MGHSGGVKKVAFSHDGAQVVSASEYSYDRSVRVWDGSASSMVADSPW